jgi:hypothetical protein
MHRPGGNYHPQTIQAGFIFIAKICYFCNPVKAFSVAGINGI